MADNVESIERIEQEQRSQREKVRRRDRLDPFSIPDREFRGRYRFTKENVQKLINILTPHLLTEEQKSKHDNKGLPFSVAQIVCCGLTDRDPDTFINRKGFHSLNVLVIGGFDRLIYDVIANVPGSFHDSTVYRLSEFKPYLESRWPRETCIGDSAFAISDVMMVPYPKPRGRDRQNKGTL